ncbi:MAG TPA: DUF86 domain-containing protein [Bacteroidia bacterium]|nr:DUF86 domain-containing protein [Bacteroidia bacterium]
MYPSQHDFLRHVLEECRFILLVTQGKSKEVIVVDETVTRAIVRSLEIIGEATKRLHPDFKLQHPQVEWKKMAATRDRMIHDYFGIDYDIVWSIITDKIPELEFQIVEILKKSE